MGSLNRTPSGERLHIGVFGRRNVGKSSLVNGLTGQSMAIVSPVPGTTTDPVSKAMELAPLGPVVIVDTAGLDDSGSLGEQRIVRSLKVLERTDLAVLVVEPRTGIGELEEQFVERVGKHRVPVVVAVNKVDDLTGGGEGDGPEVGGGVGDGEFLREATRWAGQFGYPCVPVSAATGRNMDLLKQAIVDTMPAGRGGEPVIIGDLLTPGDSVVLVVPIDDAAPKGRLILPQVMTLRDILDHNCWASVAKVEELPRVFANSSTHPRLVVTDSQVFDQVADMIPPGVPLTGFSILMARYKGDLEQFVMGLKVIKDLKPGDKVFIAEGCTHHRQDDDIGSVVIPRLLEESVGGELRFGFSAGRDFPHDLASCRLIIHCGACTLTKRDMVHRQMEAQSAGVPMTNYGLFLAWAHGILDRALEPFPNALALWQGHTPR